jgi:hypothetical protein
MDYTPGRPPRPSRLIEGGASDAGEQSHEAGHTIKAKLLNGILRGDKYEKMTWAGKGHHGLCDGCDRPILDPHVEIDADFSDGRTLRFHFRCFDAWCLETQQGPVR